MSYQFINRPLVKTDITVAFNYYKFLSPLLAKQFLFRLREAKSHIAKSPLGFQVKYKDVRTLLLKQFPYHIHYMVEEKTKMIIILAVIHAYKNPQDYGSR